MDSYNLNHIYKIHAEFFMVFANEKRLRILELLSSGEKSVGDISSQLDLSIQNVSQHLRIMREAGAVVSRKDGQTVYYKISNDKIVTGCRCIREALIEIQRKKAADIATQEY